MGKLLRGESGGPNSDSQKITDFITKQVSSQVDDQKATVQIYSNPYSAVTEVPQTTFNRADGFFLVYDSSKAETVECLSGYLQSIRQNSKRADVPIVVLSLSNDHGRDQAVDQLLAEHEIDLHFEVSDSGAEASFQALA